MKPIRLFVFLSLAVGLFACQPSSSDKGGMEQFSQDSSFQKAHESPQSIDFKPKGRPLTFATTDGKEGSGYFVTPSVNLSGKYLFVIHEWWGLNDHVKREADRLCDSLGDVAVLALDLYDGKVADNPEDAARLMESVDENHLKAIIAGALSQVGSSAQVATLGWCFGGGWSLKASILAGRQGKGCVMYYGMPVTQAADLAPLNAPVLGIFAKKDAWITPAVAKNFENLAKATNKSLQVEMFDADHAFANPSNPNFDKSAAEQANAKALAFLRMQFNK